jgi:2,3-diketo-5-methylthio-1-phosphopentane phosphatase
MSNRELLPLRTRWQVLIDFDGTIAPDDPTDCLLEQFADPLWRVLETAWQSGQLSSRECMQRQVELLRMSPEALDAAIRHVRIDAGFPAFLTFCRRIGADVRIVSDGFDRVIAAALENADLAVPFFANRLEWQGGDRWRLTFPHWRSDCSTDSANCKCAHARRRPGPRVVIGDGRSDFCMAAGADYVIAKGTLARHCRSLGRPHVTFTDFDEVTAHLSGWLATAGRAPAKAARANAPAPQLPRLQT